MNKKQGFTLVEISIVLVIIGILLSLAVKGKSLINTAKVTKDIQTINKFSTYLYIYLSGR